MFAAKVSITLISHGEPAVTLARSRLALANASHTAGNGRGYVVGSLDSHAVGSAAGAASHHVLPDHHKHLPDMRAGAYLDRSLIGVALPVASQQAHHFVSIFLAPDDSAGRK